jgi:hypothetical protein
MSAHLQYFCALCITEEILLKMCKQNIPCQQRNAKQIHDSENFSNEVIIAEEGMRERYRRSWLMDATLWRWVICSRYFVEKCHFHLQEFNDQQR